MSDLQTELRDAYENADYDVSEVTVNRGLVRVVLVGEAGAEAVRSIVTDVVGEDGAMGVNVSTEAIDGHDGVSTVISFRQRD